MVSARRAAGSNEAEERRERADVLGPDLRDMPNALVRISVREQVRVLLAELFNVRLGERVPARKFVDLE